MNLLEWFLAKDAPSVGDVHVSSTGQRKKPKGRVSQTTVLPVTGATLAAQAENPEDDPKMSKAFRALKPNDDGKTAHTPFPHDPNALANMRQDQVPRFFGALTDSEKLPTKSVKLSDLVAMQDRVDPDKVNAIREAGTDVGKPPVVVGMGGRQYIADGHHRAAAAWLDGKDSMPAKFKDLEERSQALKGIGPEGRAHLAQAIHDHACALGATCGPHGGEDNDDEHQDYVAKGADWSIPFTVAKSDGDQGLIFGWASVVEENGHLIIDKQGDAILPEDLEKAAYDFMLHARQHGQMHDTIGTGRCIESMMFTKEKQAALGIDLGKVGWWVGFKVEDGETRAAIKRGELPEFSIGGSGRRVEME